MSQTIAGDVESKTYRPRSGGWTLHLQRHRNPDRFDPALRPIVMIPGYAMNAFILGFHPTGRSMLEFLVDQGFEVWRANLRGQGESERHSGRSDYGFRELSSVDMPAVRDFVLDNTLSERETFDLIGCSLGATVVYAYLAQFPDEHKTGSVVAIGGPLRWDEIHPLLKVVFASPSLAAALPSKGTRFLARLALPIVKNVPPIAAIYMNVHQIDLSEADELVKTVEDPNPYLNRQIAHWMRDVDLMVGGVNITEAMADIHTPVMCILANKDGIVPPASALAIREAIGTDDTTVLRVGDKKNWFAHADLFISFDAESKVFVPLADWLLARQEPSGEAATSGEAAERPSGRAKATNNA